MSSEEIIQYQPSPFVPSISFSGTENRYVIRGKNVFLKSKGAGMMYAQSYKGSRPLNENPPLKTLTGTIAWNQTSNLLTGTGTLFTDELRVGMFIVTNSSPSEMFVITEVTDHLHAVVSRPFTSVSAVGVTAYIMPVMYALGAKRATQTSGNAVRFPRGHLLGVGSGNLYLDGVNINFALSKKPRYAIYNQTTGNYATIDYGIALNTTAPLFTLTQGATGTKAMFAGNYGVRVVAKSTATNGYSNPSPNAVVTIAAGKKIRITFNAAMNVADGQDAYDIYVTLYESAADAANNAVLGAHYYLETVTAAQLAVENSVANGTVSGLYHEFEYADGELQAATKILSFDNFEPYDAEFLDLINFSPIFFSCLGKHTAYYTGLATSPGAVVVAGKPDNPEAIMRDKAVTTANGDTILGVLNVRGRFWILCENSLQAVILTGVDAAPITCRSYWDVGFRNPYNAKFVKDYIFAHSTNGFLRSIGVGDESSVDFEFSTPVDDYTTNWLTAHVLTAYDPKNKAVCFFFSGYDRASGYWKTLCLPFLPNQNIWNPPIILEKANQDFIVSGVATVGQALYFLAGGRHSGGTYEVKTYEFDAPDDITIECALAWAYSDFGNEPNPTEVKGIASLIGNVQNAKVEIHGVDASGVYDLTALENGHNDTKRTIQLGSTTGLGRIREKRQTVQPYSKITVRLSFESVNGASRVDELNVLIGSNSSRK